MQYMTLLYVEYRLPSMAVADFFVRGYGKSVCRANQAAQKAMLAELKRCSGRESLDRVWMMAETVFEMGLGKQLYTRAFRPGSRYSTDAEDFNHGKYTGTYERIVKACSLFQAPERKPEPLDRVEPVGARVLYLGLAKCTVQEHSYYRNRFSAAEVQRIFEDTCMFSPEPNLHVAIDDLQAAGLLIPSPERPGDATAEHYSLATVESARLLHVHHHPLYP